MTDYELISLNPDELTEEQARDICIEVLEEYIKTSRKDNARSTVLYLLDAVVLSGLFGEPAVDSNGPALLGGSETSALRKLKKGNKKQSSIRYLKEIQARKRKQLILDYVSEAKKQKSFQVDGQDMIWNLIEHYENTCKEYPRYRDERVERAIESLSDLAKEIWTDSLLEAEVELSYVTIKTIRTRFEALLLEQQVEAVHSFQIIMHSAKNEKEIKVRLEELFQSLEATDDLH